MDESAIWEKLHSNRKITQGKAERYLNCNFSLLSMITINRHDLLALAQAVTTVQFKSWPHAISSEPVQFQVNLRNFKWTRAISSEPVQFQVNPCNFKWTRAISS